MKERRQMEGAEWERKEKGEGEREQCMAVYNSWISLHCVRPLQRAPATSPLPTLISWCFPS